jgi:putative SOS response-associated peptidase YedK
MCFFTQQNAPAKEVKHRFIAEIDNEENFLQSNEIIGPIHPNIPIILDTTPNIITTNYTWGLMPHWGGSKQLDFRKGKLNARIEDIDSTPSYKNIQQNRCLIIATAYYEWRWLDPKGKQKEKYQINSQYNEIFTFAGLYDSWINPDNGQYLMSYTMVTTQANDTMRFIHNQKERMPVMLKHSDEHAWLDPQNDIKEFAFPEYNCKLVGFKIA